jgi:hypothetical protein
VPWRCTAVPDRPNRPTGVRAADTHTFRGDYRQPRQYLRKWANFSRITRQKGSEKMERVLTEGLCGRPGWDERKDAKGRGS